MKPVYFEGVDGVRLVKRGKKCYVQTDWSDPLSMDAHKVPWHDIGDEYDTLDEAMEASYELCNF